MAHKENTCCQEQIKPTAHLPCASCDKYCVPIATTQVDSVMLVCTGADPHTHQHHTGKKRSCALFSGYSWRETTPVIHMCYDTEKSRIFSMEIQSNDDR